MNYVGVDIHKHYSVLVVVDERGQELKRGRIINGNEREKGVSPHY